MEVPADAAEVCPVCDVAYDSVSEHDAGVMVNLLDNRMYRRVCFEPVAGAEAPRLRFYHHTHEEVGADDVAVETASEGGPEVRR
ncbi:hypothetical protein SAMN04487949_1258 [Halogranum gelatinilyticum]|uniref:DUF8145 domain-containing protein n=1 Tax=Halogranum gelatinilyticum TaxID=660521 RepID=A0A1G9RAH6_9EURY|nr:hypothetical protein [Halogranum gelatinilyticum]SDM20266.1 hypothetical protein SAMN04487949_1258 [Halogranum gelatinilyticum]